MPRSTVVAPGIACEGSTLPSEDTQHALVNQSLAGVIVSILSIAVVES